MFQFEINTDKQTIFSKYSTTVRARTYSMEYMTGWVTSIDEYKRWNSIATKYQICVNSECFTCTVVSNVH